MHLQPFFAPVANRIIFIASIFTSKAIKCVLIVLIFTYAVNVLPSDVRWNVLWCNFGRWPVKRSTFATFDPRLCSPSILSSIVLLSINIDDETKKKRNPFYFLWATKISMEFWFFPFSCRFAMLMAGSEQRNYYTFPKSNQEFSMEKETKWEQIHIFFKVRCEAACNFQRYQMDKMFYDYDYSSCRKLFDPTNLWGSPRFAPFVRQSIDAFLLFQHSEATFSEWQTISFAGGDDDAINFFSCFNAVHCFCPCFCVCHTQHDCSSHIV